MREERDPEKKKVEADAKIKEADKKILGAARDPLPHAMYCELLGYFGKLGWD